MMPLPKPKADGSHDAELLLGSVNRSLERNRELRVENERLRGMLKELLRHAKTAHMGRAVKLIHCPVSLERHAEMSAAAWPEDTSDFDEDQK